MRWLADENFNGNIVEGLLRRKPALDIVRAQDTDIAGASDTAVVDWAACQGRLLLSHDMNTLTGFRNAGDNACSTSEYQSFASLCGAGLLACLDFCRELKHKRPAILPSRNAERPDTVSAIDELLDLSAAWA